MKLINTGLIILLIVFIGLIIHLALDTAYAESLGMKSDDLCLFLDMLDNYVRFQ